MSKRDLSPDSLEAQADALLAAADSMDIPDEIPMPGKSSRSGKAAKAARPEADHIMTDEEAKKAGIVRLDDKQVAALPAASWLMGQEKLRELLARLKAEGARMCICSNTWSAQCRTVLTRLGIDEYFDFYVEAQGALHKSRPDVFFQTLTRLGGTDPDRCVVCEDSLYAARTAHDAGFHVIGIADAASKSDEPALRDVSDQFLTDWTELDWNKV